MKLSLPALIRTVLIILIISTVAMCAFWLPFAVEYALGSIGGDTEIMRPLLFTACLIIAVPLLVIFGISFRFAADVEADTIFSQRTARRLSVISIVIFIDCVAFTAGIVWLLVSGERVLSPALAFVDVIGVTVALMLAVLSRYVKRAAILKEEVDCTL